MRKGNRGVTRLFAKSVSGTKAWYSKDVGGNGMKKVILTLLLLGVAGVMPLQFAQTGGNLKPVAVLAPINEEKPKGEQK